MVAATRRPSHLTGIMTSFDDCWFLTGATASGKTAVGIELARTLNAEIVSMDSMALFRRMDIGTAKPSMAERAEITHHLIDVVEPYQDFSLAEYLNSAERVAADIQKRGNQVLFVGGTPLYLKALLRGVFEGPPADWELRQRWEAFAQEHGNTALHAELVKVDPLTAARLHPHDARRVVRALEVFEKTGESITRLQQQFDRARSASECRVFMLSWPRETLVERINARVDEMFARGWIDEVKLLIADGKPLSRTALQAVGYAEIVEHLGTQNSISETIERVRIRTRQFAKRQLTWFRSLSECRWLELSQPFDPKALADKIAQSA
jgi:tRNA dimethylallyltransferase